MLDGWISTRDSFPKNFTKVLAYTSDNNTRVLTFEGGFWRDYYGFISMIYSVKYWMPLPEVPDDDAAVDALVYNELYEPTYNSQDGSM